jgi:crotonobetainyl-CoA:carnitine CoA-transferase CaiB-like acyl-CoA transferase
LADLGAEVIKINTLWDRFWLSTHMGVASNRGKRSIALNLKDPRGREVAQKLCAGADAVVHNMRVGVAERLGVDYASVAALNPSVVYCHSRGFDRGPRLALPGTDQTASALAGVEWEDGGCGRGGRPFWSPTSIGDTGNGFLAAIAIVQALLHRARSGEGQQVDTAILNACLLASSATWVREDGTGPDRRRLDADQLGFDSFHRLYEAADAWICVSADRDQRPRLLTALEIDATVDESDERLAELISGAIRAQSAEAVVEKLDRADVPAERSSETFPTDFFADEEVWARGLLTRLHHPILGPLEEHGHLIEFSETPGHIGRPAPLCGEHSVELLTELGMDERSISELVTDKVIVDGRPG